MTTIHRDILGMDQEDMVDEIMTLRQQNAALVMAMEKLVDTNITFSEGMVFAGVSYKDVQQAREVLKLAKGEK